MKFTQLKFTKSWERPTDFPTYEESESQVRADLQLLHDETRDYLNNTLLPELGEQICVVTALPKGRAKGDVDGDGLVSESDAELVQNHFVGNITLSGEEVLWAADIYGDGSVDPHDATAILEYANGILDQYSQYAADYYGNWKWDGEKGCYYYDIPIPGLTAEQSAVVMLGTAVENGVLTDAQCVEGAVRINARGIPTHEVSCSVLCSTSAAGAMIMTSGTGHTPVKGVDYFTAEDKAEIVQEVSADLDVGVKTINGNAPDEDGNIEISTDTSSTASTTAISVTEETDGSVTIVETLSDGSNNTAVITPDESGNPVTLTYNGTAIPITWTEATA